MDEIRYITLDPITKLFDKIRYKIRRKEVEINGETWTYQYHFGDLISLSDKIQIIDNIRNSKTIKFNEKTKLPFKCEESNWYSKEGFPGGVNHGKQHDYLIDIYGRNIGDLKIEHWEHGKKNGNFKRWNESGFLTSDKYYVHGKPVGTHRVFCKNCKQLLFEGNYDDFGIPINIHIFYECYGFVHENTFKYLTKKIIFQDGYNDYEEIIYYDKSDQIRSSGKYYDKDSGVCKVYNKNGNLSEVINYENGYKNGHYERYTEDGNLIEEGDYGMDKKIGNWTINEDIEEDKDD